MAKVGVQIDGTMVLVGVALAGVAYVYYKRKEVAKVATVGLNPTHRENYVNQATKSFVGESNLANYADHFFGVVTNYTPWALFSSDAEKAYGKKIWSETLGLKE